MLRHLSVLAAALALASCSGPISKDDCTKAGQAGTWEVSFSLSNGDATKCPVLQTKTIQMGACEASCGCTESTVVFTPAENSAVADRCSLRFEELCSGYQLDCRYVDVVSATAAGGSCFYKAGTQTCDYSASWSKKP